MVNHRLSMKLNRSVRVAVVAAALCCWCCLIHAVASAEQRIGSPSRSRPYNCPCTGIGTNEECTNTKLGRTYTWREINSSQTVSDIPSAINYTDTQLCNEDGYRRVALETRDELMFLVKCLLCNQETYFGRDKMKLNIMTAGIMNGYSEEDAGQEWRVLEGKWSIWGEGVGSTVPNKVVVLNSRYGNLTDRQVDTPPGYFYTEGSYEAEEPYAIFLVGNGQRLCGKDSDTYLTWGLMSHQADGPLDDLVGYVVCEREARNYTTTPAASDTSTVSHYIPMTHTSTQTADNNNDASTANTTNSDEEKCCKFENGTYLCPGNVLQKECSLDYSGSKEVECIEGRIVVEDHCIADWINNVDSLVNSGDESAVDIARVLKNATSDQPQITQVDLTCLVSVVSSLTDLLEQQIANIADNEVQGFVYNYTNHLVKIEVNLLTREGVWDDIEKEESGRLGSSLLHDLERTGFILANYVEGTMNITDPTLNMTVLSKPRNELAGHELYFPGESSDTFIRLPEDFQNLLPQNEIRLVGFFLDQKAASRALPAALSSNYSEDKPKEINSFVVSMTLGNLDYSVTFPKTGSVLLRLQHAYRESGSYYRDLYRLPRDGEVPSRIPGTAECVYWHPKRSEWVDNGCKLINSTRDVTYCSCEHLSMISVITDVRNYVGRDAVLDVLGTVLSSLSCIALLGAVYILQFCKGVQASPRISITKQLCVSLFFSHLFLILFLDRDFLKLSEVGCEVVAVVLHYLLTAAICWMLAEGLQLFQAVRSPFDKTSFMVAYWLIGYGMPAVVVLATLVTAFAADQWEKQQAYTGSEYCWLTTEEGYMWAFTGPLVVITVINATFMVLGIRSGVNLKANRRKTLPHRILLCIKGSFSLNCVLGVTWVFGLLYIEANHAFAYIFIIFNASQGVMIFVFTCVLNEDVRTAFITSLPKVLQAALHAKGPGQVNLRNLRANPSTGPATTSPTTPSPSTCNQGM